METYQVHFTLSYCKKTCEKYVQEVSAITFSEIFPRLSVKFHNPPSPTFQASGNPGDRMPDTTVKRTLCLVHQ